MSYKKHPPQHDRDISVCDTIVKKVWEEQANYKIEYTQPSESNGSSICAIYFSSNGIYFPNTEKTFLDVIVKKDRYEWYCTRVKKASKHIFIRDVFKQWYIKGINSQICSQKDLFEFLKKETSGYEVITIGSSAGGYASALFGSQLGASLSLAFSPQISLQNLIVQSNEERNPLLHKYASIVQVNIQNQIKNNENLFVFYGKDSQIDREDIMLASNIGINQILFYEKLHGVPFKNYALPTIINKKKDSLMNLGHFVHYPLLFSLRYCDWIYLFRKIKKRLKFILKHNFILDAAN